MNYNLNTWYWLVQACNAPFTLWKIFTVTDIAWTWAAQSLISQIYRTDTDWVDRVFWTITLALVQCVSWRWDVIILAPDFTTALTAAELLSAEAKWVTIVPSWKNIDGRYFANKATAALPATALWALFTVTWRVKLLSIIWEVTTIIQTQTCLAKLVANPTVWADVDICADLDITAWAVWAQLSITWTLANAMVKTVSWAWVFQAASLLILPWTIDLNTSATNTWSVKWRVEYQPIDPWARIY